MSEFSEKDIITYLKNSLNDEFNFKNCTRIQDKMAIQGLLDLYNEEKEKNKKLDRENQALYESINCDDKNMLERLYKEEKEKSKELEKDISEMYYKGVVLDILQDELNISRDEAIEILENY